MSEKIGNALDPDRSITADEDCLSWATHFGISRAQGQTRDAVLWMITKSVSVPGRHHDLARWYLFRLATDLQSQQSRTAPPLALEGALADMADQLAADRKAMDSLEREARRSNFDRFEPARAIGDGEHRIASTRTYCYLAASNILRSMGFIR